MASQPWGRSGPIDRTHSTNSHPRPLWQLLLAEQTGQLLLLTCAECQALLELFSDLLDEGYELHKVSRRLAPCLARIQECGGQV